MAGAGVVGEEPPCVVFVVGSGRRWWGSGIAVGWEEIETVWVPDILLVALMEPVPLKIAAVPV